MANNNRFTIQDYPWDLTASDGNQTVTVPEISRLSRTFADFTPDGTSDKVTMWVDVENVAEHGTYADGSWWVVPTPGQVVKVTGASHVGNETLVTDCNVTPKLSSNPDVYTQADFTIRYNGVMKNPILGPDQDETVMKDYPWNRPSYVQSNEGLWDQAAIFAAGRGRGGDNRININYDVNSQAELDFVFDIDAFNDHRTKLATEGQSIDLQHDDVLILTDSMFDETNKTFYSTNSLGAAPAGWNCFSGVRYHQALYVRDTAPAADALRPPAQWDLTRGPRPEFSMSDLALDYFSYISSANVVDEPAYSYIDSSEYAYDITDPDQHAPCVMLHGLNYYQTAMASYAIKYGNTSNYGGTFIPAAGLLPLSEAKRAKDAGNDALATQWLQHAMQWALDGLGAFQTRTGVTSSGAGQKPMLGQYVMLFCRLFGVQDNLNRPVKSITDIYKWFWDLTDAEWDAYSSDEKRNALTIDFGENTTVSYNEQEAYVVADPTTGFPYLSPGGTYDDILRDNISIDKVSGHVPSVTTEICDPVGDLDTNGTAGTVTIETQNTNGQYVWENLVAGNALGRLDLSEPLTMPGNDGPSRSAKANNLVGCTVTVGTNDYYIVGASENCNPRYPNDSRDPAKTARLYVHPELPADITGLDIVVKAFRDSDKDNMVYNREPHEPQKQAWISPCPWSDGYANFGYTGLALPVMICALIDGNRNDIGNYGNMICDTYNLFGDNVSGRDWIVQKQQLYKLGGAAAPLLTDPLFTGNIRDLPV